PIQPSHAGLWVAPSGATINDGAQRLPMRCLSRGKYWFPAGTNSRLAAHSALARVALFIADPAPRRIQMILQPRPDHLDPPDLAVFDLECLSHLKTRRPVEILHRDVLAIREVNRLHRAVLIE